MVFALIPSNGFKGPSEKKWLPYRCGQIYHRWRETHDHDQFKLKHYGKGVGERPSPLLHIIEFVERVTRYILLVLLENKVQ